MTGAPDQPEDSQNKFAARHQSLEVENQLVKPSDGSASGRTAQVNALAGQICSAKSEPITWKSVVEADDLKSNSAASLTTEHAHEESLNEQVEEFLQLLKKHRVAALNWRASLKKQKKQRIDEVESYVCAANNATTSPPLCVTENKAFIAEEKRYVLGSEIALAVIIAAAGATRIRASMHKVGPRSELIPGGSYPGELKNPLTTGDEKSEKADREIRDADQVTDSRRQQNHSHSSKLHATVRPKTIVASTDTLVSIAEAFFYDQNVAWLIADLNRSILKETWMDNKRIIELKSRQQIELPLWTDIEDFYRTKPDHARPENLITIVEQTAIDAELLNSSLGKLLNPDPE